MKCTNPADRPCVTVSSFIFSHSSPHIFSHQLAAEPVRAAARRQERREPLPALRGTATVTSHILDLSPHFTTQIWRSWSGSAACTGLLPVLLLLRSVFSRLLSACCQWTSSASPRLYSSTCFHRSASSSYLDFLSLSLSLSSPPHTRSLSLSLSLCLSLSHCIHFCAFKKSPRITNLEESEQSRVPEEAAGCQPKQTRTDRLLLFQHASQTFLKDGSDGLDRI